MAVRDIEVEVSVEPFPLTPKPPTAHPDTEEEPASPTPTNTSTSGSESPDQTKKEQDVTGASADEEAKAEIEDIPIVKRMAQEDKEVVATMVRGYVKWFSLKEGYGFLLRYDTKEDVFVHQTAVKKQNPKQLLRSLGDGEEVEFDVVIGDRGNEAANVTGPGGEHVRGSSYNARRRFFTERRTRGMPGTKEAKAALEENKAVKKAAQGENKGAKKAALGENKENVDGKKKDQNAKAVKEGGDENSGFRRRPVRKSRKNFGGGQGGSQHLDSSDSSKSQTGERDGVKEKVEEKKAYGDKVEHGEGGGRGRGGRGGRASRPYYRYWTRTRGASTAVDSVRSSGIISMTATSLIVAPSTESTIPMIMRSPIPSPNVSLHTDGINLC